MRCSPPCILLLLRFPTVLLMRLITYVCFPSFPNRFCPQSLFLPTTSSIFLAFLSRRFSSAIANQESLSTLEVEMRKLEGVVKEVVDEMAYLQRREARMRDTNGLFLSFL